MSYTVFKRAWWKENPSWPNGLEPSASEKSIIDDNVSSEEEAREICQEYNDSHDGGRYSIKYEFTKN